MALVAGAKPQSPEHDAALTWAAALSRSLDTLDRAALKAAWDGEEGKAHREQLKKTAPDALRLLVVYVREHAESLPKP